MSTFEDNTILGVLIGQQRYAIAQAQVDHLGLVDPREAPTDLRGNVLICRELGALLGADQSATIGRRSAITIRLRRRSIALMIDHVDSLGDAGQLKIQPLSALLTRRLARPWFLGAIVYQDAPILLLDLRRIATDVVIGAA